MALTVFEEPYIINSQNNLEILLIDDFSIPFVNFSAATFRDTIRLYLREYTQFQDYTIDGNSVYCLLLASKATGVVFPIFTVEELVSHSSPSPLCDFCRFAGWSHHYVSKRRYHFIIPMSDEWKKPLTKDSLNLNSSHHLMHGVIHCNGFGHLLSINADVSNDYLSGDHIMDYWDCLCSTLHPTKISLDDISRKGSMDLRLLHGVAYGRPWFGKWSYKFSHGSFGFREEHYSRAILILSSMEVDRIMEDFSGGTNKERVMKMVIRFYRESSETPLVTLSDLLRFMLTFRYKAPVGRRTAMALVESSFDLVPTPSLEDYEGISPCCSSPDQELDDNVNDCNGDTTLDDCDTTMANTRSPKYDSFEAMAKGESSRWSGRRLNEAAQAVIKVFEERNSIITRQELREAVRNSIGDTGLIDFLLKNIDKVLIGDHIVQRFTDPKNRKLQFSLQTFKFQTLDQSTRNKRKLKLQETDEWTSTLPGLSQYKDILYLYQNLLFAYPDSDIISAASEVILSCKSFVREGPLPSSQDLLTVSCQVLPSHEELLRDFTRRLPPGEVVMVPQNATIRELKSAVEKAMRDTYCVMDGFEVLEMRRKDMEKLEDTWDLESEGNNFNKEFLVKGFGLDTSTELRYEGGFDDWTVDCKCGAIDDDGERMVSCDDCKVWQHTLCNNIEDDESVPSNFFCNRCSEHTLRPKKRSNSMR